MKKLFRSMSLMIVVLAALGLGLYYVQTDFRVSGEFRILPLGALDLTASGGQLLLGEVLAVQTARQIGRADDQPAIKKLHLALLLQGSL